jgi:hypothetical protein
MKTPIQIIVNAKKELNQNDFCDWLQESLDTFKELEKTHITKAYLMGSVDRLTDRAAMTSEEYYNHNYNE